MLDEENEVAFAMWTSETGIASREHWNSEKQDKWIRMARVAIHTIERIRG